MVNCADLQAFQEIQHAVTSSTGTSLLPLFPVQLFDTGICMPSLEPPFWLDSQAGELSF